MPVGESTEKDITIGNKRINYVIQTTISFLKDLMLFQIIWPSLKVSK